MLTGSTSESQGDVNRSERADTDTPSAAGTLWRTVRGPGQSPVDGGRASSSAIAVPFGSGSSRVAPQRRAVRSQTAVFGRSAVAAWTELGSGLGVAPRGPQVLGLPRPDLSGGGIQHDAVRPGGFLA